MREKPFIHKREGEWRIRLPLVGFAREHQVIRKLPSHASAVKLTWQYLKYRTNS